MSQESIYIADKIGDSKYYTKGGFLNSYSLACGYIESLWVGDHRISMGFEGCFDVKFAGNLHGEYIRIWEGFDSIGEARVAFLRLCKWVIAASGKDEREFVR
jgi:hypothetical protein